MYYRPCNAIRPGNQTHLEAPASSAGITNNISDVNANGLLDAIRYRETYKKRAHLYYCIVVKNKMFNIVVKDTPNNTNVVRIYCTVVKYVGAGHYDPELTNANNNNNYK